MAFTWNSKTRFNIYSLVTADQVGIQIASLDVLYHNNETFIDHYLQQETQKEVDKINERDISTIPEDELHTLTRAVSDYYGLSHETKEVLSHYMIVATYSFYEKALKKMLSLTNQFTSGELRNCHKKVRIVQLLQQKFSIDYATLIDNDRIEELRCLNNDIKHNGVAGTELVAANNQWTLNQPLENTKAAFDRLKDAPRNMLLNLAQKVEPHM